MAIAAIATAWFGGALWRSTDKLWTETKRLAVGAEKQASDFRESLRVAEANLATMKTSQRAHIDSQNFYSRMVHFKDTNIKHMIFQIEFMNTGPTAAHDLCIFVALYLFEPVDLQNKVNLEYSKPPFSGATLGSGNTVLSSPEAISLDEAIAIHEGRLAAILFGRAWCVDIFGDEVSSGNICVRVLINADPRSNIPDDSTGRGLDIVTAGFTNFTPVEIPFKEMNEKLILKSIERRNILWPVSAPNTGHSGPPPVVPHDA